MEFWNDEVAELKTDTFRVRRTEHLLKRTELGDLEAGGGLSLLGRGKGGRSGDD
jgi:hypothetical protein